MARSIGQAMREFKKAQREINDEINRPDPPADTKQSPPSNKPIE